MSLYLVDSKGVNLKNRSPVGEFGLVPVLYPIQCNLCLLEFCRVFVLQENVQLSFPLHSSDFTSLNEI